MSRKHDQSFSRRPKKLTEAQEANLEEWLKSPRTYSAKATQLGISRRALYDYLKGRHKPRKQSVDIEQLVDELTSHRREVSLGTLERV